MLFLLQKYFKMYSSLLQNSKLNLKFINIKYFIITLFKKKLILKKIYINFLKKNLYFFLNLNFQNSLLINFFKKFWNFLHGSKIFFNVLGRRFKFFINNNFLFFKMDTSKYCILKMLENIWLKKKKKIISFFFFDILICQFIKKILKLKKPNKYTKKGIELYLI